MISKDEYDQLLLLIREDQEIKDKFFNIYKAFFSAILIGLTLAYVSNTTNDIRVDQALYLFLAFIPLNVTIFFWYYFNLNFFNSVKQNLALAFYAEQIKNFNDGILLVHVLLHTRNTYSIKFDEIKKSLSDVNVKFELVKIHNKKDKFKIYYVKYISPLLTLGYLLYIGWYFVHLLITSQTSLISASFFLFIFLIFSYKEQSQSLKLNKKIHWVLASYWIFLKNKNDLYNQFMISATTSQEAKLDKFYTKLKELLGSDDFNKLIEVAQKKICYETFQSELSAEKQKALNDFLQSNQLVEIMSSN